jgi:cytochrome c oxidase cbb3-type subunit 3
MAAILVLAFWRGPGAGAQAGGGQAGGGRGATQGGGRGGAITPTRFPTLDPEAIDRGRTAFVANCGFCHGPTAQGGDGGPGLIRSLLVLDDNEGRQLGQFLKNGRPDKGMPKFDRLNDQDVGDIAAYLKSRIIYSAGRGDIRVENILVGDPAAGQAYFNGAGGCAACHSPAGDLAGIGVKYDAEVLQNRIVMPREGRGGAPAAAAAVGPGGGGRESAAPPPPKPITATIKLPSGETMTGELVRLTEFDVTIRDASGRQRSTFRNNGVPQVEVHDPVQAHIDLWPKLTDRDLHNLTAYLASLK